MSRARRCSAVALAAALIGVAQMPARAAATDVPPPSLAVTGAALFEPTTGRVLYGIDPDGERAIASTTKIMTALITLQHVRHLDEIFTQNDWRAAAVDSQIGLAPGERMSVHDLLLATLLPSADDAAEDLAYNVGHGSIARFVAMMNAEAATLGLAHTHYTTPIGLDTPGNYSTPSDLVRLASYVLSHEPFFAHAVALPHATLLTGSHVRDVVNRNDLVGRVPWVDGVKTGHTAAAGYVLVLSGKRGGMRLLGAVLGTTSETARDDNALSLLDYGFAEWHFNHVIRAGQVLARPFVRDSPGKHATLIADSGFVRLLRLGARVTLRVKAPRELSGPLPRHAILGQVTVFVDGRPAGRVPLLLARALPAVSPLTQVGRFLTKSSTLLALSLLLVAALLLTTARRMLRRRNPGRAAAGDLEAG